MPVTTSRRIAGEASAPARVRCSAAAGSIALTAGIVANQTAPASPRQRRRSAG